MIIIILIMIINCFINHSFHERIYSAGIVPLNEIKDNPIMQS